MADKSPITDKQRNISDGMRRKLENLKPFQPGQSGNPAGRTKRKSLTEKMAELLAMDSLEGVEVPEGKTVGDVVARQVVKHACHGRFQYAKELLDRIDGKVPDRIIDETSDADSDRTRSELDLLLDALRERTGIAAAQGDPGTAEPGRNGDGHVGGPVDPGQAPGPAQ
jgi:hypothetical protein